VESTLAPTSSTTTGEPVCVGSADAKAGRSTPRTMPWMIFAVAITAPVFPDDTTPCAMPFSISREATLMEESFLVRTALAAESSIVMNSLA
jgi:hypothetical protein